VSVDEHREDAPASVRCFILTISDTRTAQTDRSGDVLVETLTAAGHEISGRSLVADDPSAVRGAIVLATLHADAIITTGGTGIAGRDSTYAAISALLEKHLDGFGELFRMLSYEQIGAAAMLSRACAGTIASTVVFALPGSPKAVRLALDRLIVPELPHIVRELKRKS
jgi:molybdenum cofactor biosynthesis protein B